eukprot:gene504-897_t
MTSLQDDEVPRDLDACYLSFPDDELRAESDQEDDSPACSFDAAENEPCVSLPPLEKPAKTKKASKSSKTGGKGAKLSKGPKKKRGVAVAPQRRKVKVQPKRLPVSYLPPIPLGRLLISVTIRQCAQEIAKEKPDEPLDESPYTQNLLEEAQVAKRKFQDRARAEKAKKEKEERETPSNSPPGRRNVRRGLILPLVSKPSMEDGPKRAWGSGQPARPAPPKKLSEGAPKRSRKSPGEESQPQERAGADTERNQEEKALQAKLREAQVKGLEGEVASLRTQLARTNEQMLDRGDSAGSDAAGLCDVSPRGGLGTPNSLLHRRRLGKGAAEQRPLEAGAGISTGTQGAGSAPCDRAWEETGAGESTASLEREKLLVQVARAERDVQKKAAELLPDILKQRAAGSQQPAPEKAGKRKHGAAELAEAEDRLLAEKARLLQQWQGAEAARAERALGEARSLRDQGVSGKGLAALIKTGKKALGRELQALNRDIQNQRVDAEQVAERRRMLDLWQSAAAARERWGEHVREEGGALRAAESSRSKAKTDVWRQRDMLEKWRAQRAQSDEARDGPRMMEEQLLGEHERVLCLWEATLPAKAQLRGEAALQGWAAEGTMGEREAEELEALALAGLEVVYQERGVLANLVRAADTAAGGAREAGSDSVEEVKESAVPGRALLHERGFLLDMWEEAERQAIGAAAEAKEEWTAVRALDKGPAGVTPLLATKGRSDLAWERARLVEAAALLAAGCGLAPEGSSEERREERRMQQESVAVLAMWETSERVKSRLRVGEAPLDSVSKGALRQGRADLEKEKWKQMHAVAALSARHAGGLYAAAAAVERTMLEDRQRILDLWGEAEVAKSRMEVLAERALRETLPGMSHEAGGAAERPSQEEVQRLRAQELGEEQAKLHALVAQLEAEERPSQGQRRRRELEERRRLLESWKLSEQSREELDAALVVERREAAVAGRRRAVEDGERKVSQARERRKNRLGNLQAAQELLEQRRVLREQKGETLTAAEAKAEEEELEALLDATAEAERLHDEEEAELTAELDHQREAMELEAEAAGLGRGEVARELAEALQTGGGGDAAVQLEHDLARMQQALHEERAKLAGAEEALRLRGLEDAQEGEEGAAEARLLEDRRRVLRAWEEAEKAREKAQALLAVERRRRRAAEQAATEVGGGHGASDRGAVAELARQAASLEVQIKQLAEVVETAGPGATPARAQVEAQLEAARERARLVERARAAVASGAQAVSLAREGRSLRSDAREEGERLLGAAAAQLCAERSALEGGAAALDAREAAGELEQVEAGQAWSEVEAGRRVLDHWAEALQASALRCEQAAVEGAIARVKGGAEGAKMKGQGALAALSPEQQTELAELEEHARVLGLWEKWERRVLELAAARSEGNGGVEMAWRAWDEEAAALREADCSHKAEAEALHRELQVADGASRTMLEERKRLLARWEASLAAERSRQSRADLERREGGRSALDREGVALQEMAASVEISEEACTRRCALVEDRRVLGRWATAEAEKARLVEGRLFDEGPSAAWRSLAGGRRDLEEEQAAIVQAAVKLSKGEVAAAASASTIAAKGALRRRRRLLSQWETSQHNAEALFAQAEERARLLQLWEGSERAGEGVRARLVEERRQVQEEATMQAALEKREQAEAARTTASSAREVVRRERARLGEARAQLTAGREARRAEAEARGQAYDPAEDVAAEAALRAEEARVEKSLEQHVRALEGAEERAAALEREIAEEEAQAAEGIQQGCEEREAWVQALRSQLAAAAQALEAELQAKDAAGGGGAAAEKGRIDLAQQETSAGVLARRVDDEVAAEDGVSAERAAEMAEAHRRTLGLWGESERAKEKLCALLEMERRRRELAEEALSEAALAAAAAATEAGAAAGAEGAAPENALVRARRQALSKEKARLREALGEAAGRGGGAPEEQAELDERGRLASPQMAQVVQLWEEAAQAAAAQQERSEMMTAAACRRRLEAKRAALQELVEAEQRRAAAASGAPALVVGGLLGDVAAAKGEGNGARVSCERGPHAEAWRLLVLWEDSVRIGEEVRRRSAAGRPFPGRLAVAEGRNRLEQEKANMRKRRERAAAGEIGAHLAPSILQEQSEVLRLWEETEAHVARLVDAEEASEAMRPEGLLITAGLRRAVRCLAELGPEVAAARKMSRGRAEQQLQEAAKVAAAWEEAERAGCEARLQGYSFALSEVPSCGPMLLVAKPHAGGVYAFRGEPASAEEEARAVQEARAAAQGALVIVQSRQKEEGSVDGEPALWAQLLRRKWVVEAWAAAGRGRSLAMHMALAREAVALAKMDAEAAANGGAGAEAGGKVLDPEASAASLEVVEGNLRVAGRWLAAEQAAAARADAGEGSGAPDHGLVVGDAAISITVAAASRRAQLQQELVALRSLEAEVRDAENGMPGVRQLAPAAVSAVRARRQMLEQWRSAEEAEEAEAVRALDAARWRGRRDLERERAAVSADLAAANVAIERGGTREDVERARAAKHANGIEAVQALLLVERQRHGLQHQQKELLQRKQALQQRKRHPPSQAGTKVGKGKGGKGKKGAPPARVLEEGEDDEAEMRAVGALEAEVHRREVLLLEQEAAVQNGLLDPSLSQMERLSGEVEALSHAEHRAGQVAEALREDAAGLRGEVEAARGLEAQARAECRVKEASLAERKEAEEALKAKLAETESKLRATRFTKAGELRAQAVAAEREKEKREKERGEQERALAAAVAEARHAEEEVAIKEAARAELEARLAEVESAAQQAAQQAAEAARMHGESYEELQEQLGATEAARRGEEERKKLLEREVLEAEQQQEAAEGRADVAERRSAELQARLDELEMDLKGAHASAAETAAQAAEAEQKRVELEAQAAAAEETRRVEAAKAEAMAAELQRQEAGLKEQLGREEEERQLEHAAALRALESHEAAQLALRVKIEELYKEQESLQNSLTASRETEAAEKHRREELDADLRLLREVQEVNRRKESQLETSNKELLREKAALERALDTKEAQQGAGSQEMARELEMHKMDVKLQLQKEVVGKMAALADAARHAQAQAQTQVDEMDELELRNLQLELGLGDGSDQTLPDAVQAPLEEMLGLLLAEGAQPVQVYYLEQQAASRGEECRCSMMLKKAQARLAEVVERRKDSKLQLDMAKSIRHPAQIRHARDQHEQLVNKEILLARQLASLQGDAQRKTSALLADVPDEAPSGPVPPGPDDAALNDLVARLAAKEAAAGGIGHLVLCLERVEKCGDTAENLAAAEAAVAALINVIHEADTNRRAACELGLVDKAVRLLGSGLDGADSKLTRNIVILLRSIVVNKELREAAPLELVPRLTSVVMHTTNEKIATNAVWVLSSLTQNSAKFQELAAGEDIVKWLVAQLKNGAAAGLAAAAAAALGNVAWGKKANAANLVMVEAVAPLMRLQKACAAPGSRWRAAALHKSSAAAGKSAGKALAGMNEIYTKPQKQQLKEHVLIHVTDDLGVYYIFKDQGDSEPTYLLTLDGKKYGDDRVAFATFLAGFDFILRQYATVVPYDQNHDTQPNNTNCIGRYLDWFGTLGANCLTCHASFLGGTFYLAGAGCKYSPCCQPRPTPTQVEATHYTSE